jgi:hypothetical protein
LTGAGLIYFLNDQRLRWLGHVQRIPEERDFKKIYKLKAITARPFESSEITWMDTVMKDMQAVKIVNWKS